MPAEPAPLSAALFHQNLVGVLNSLEFVFGKSLKFIAQMKHLVRVIHVGQPAVGLPNLILGGPRRKAENLKRVLGLIFGTGLRIFLKRFTRPASGTLTSGVRAFCPR